jgi:hypothetical protein
MHASNSVTFLSDGNLGFFWYISKASLYNLSRFPFDFTIEYNNKEGLTYLILGF